MAPRDFRNDQRSKSPKGSSKAGKGARPFRGKPGPGPKAHGAKAHAGPKAYKPAGASPYKSDGPRPHKPAGAKPYRSAGPSPYKSDGPRPHKPAGAKPAYRPARPKPHKPADGNASFRPQRPERGPRPERPVRSENWLYGIHAVQAALANPRRKLGRLLLTRRAAEILGEERPDRVRVEIMEMDAIGKFLPPGAVHQGAALDAASLPAIDLDELLAKPASRRRIVLVLDQLSDPHNVGAILRSAAAFGVTAVVVQDRHAPPQGGALAKAASGALDLIPYVEVVNIARALDQLANHGFWRIAMAGDGAQPLTKAIPDGDVALVLGSEGDGIRRLVREHCEAAAFIPMPGAMESLNVSNAAAIALYELTRT